MIRLDRVHQIRATLVGLFRLFAVGLIAFGSFLILARLAFGLIGNGNLTSVFRVWQGIGEGHGIYRGIPMILIGFVFAVKSRSLAHWIIRPPESGCTNCGYPVPEDTKACPECGRPTE